MAVLSFFAASGQDQVIIPPDVADYFLMRDDRARALDSLMIVKDEKFENLSLQLDNQTKVIKTYQADSSSFAAIIAAKDVLLKLFENEIEYNLKQARKQRRQKYVLAGTAGGAVAGSFFGQPLIGAAIGAGTGFVVGLLKRRV